MRPNDNPNVNRYLDDKAMDHIDHALGRPAWPLRETYRNYFSTEAGGKLAVEFDASPFWKHRNTAGTMAWYSVTDAGRQALAEHLASQDAARVYTVTYAGHNWNVPAKSASKARYSYFLDIRDCLGDLSFSDFARRSRVRLAP